ncbi:hypothetical protein HWV62_12134 [Athelia sp. TMB]|nr:hypothetical protein HWV62_12134 [Athelia sp. TMB]
MNSLFALFEIFLTDVRPSPWIHVVFLEIFIVCYLGVAYITHTTEGFYTYDCLGPSKEHDLLAAYIVGIAVGGALVFAIVKGLMTLRLRFFRRGLGDAAWDADEDKGGVEAIDALEEVPRREGAGDEIAWSRCVRWALGSGPFVSRRNRYEAAVITCTEDRGEGMKTGFPSYLGAVVRPSPGPHQYSSAASSDAEDYSSGSNTNSHPFTPNELTSAGGAGEEMERVVNVKNCPLCHRPRLNKKAEVDIVTHLAVCASGDWAKIDRIVVGNFVTASQAQRKWYTKIISKVSSGDYRLGTNSANIIAQIRMTGQLEEKMQVYIRLGIRLLYKAAKSRMEGARARCLLKSLFPKQGLKYDDPASARDIKPFIDFHRLKIEEIRDPIESFKTFDEFFYREATRLWIKGREFTIARLVGDPCKDQVERYNGGAVAVFRLAPQDYHRFHSPVDGTIGNTTYIPGEYHTVNPQAIRTILDVYGENVRKIVPIDSPVFGRVMAVCVGAMMVGSIKTTLGEGDAVARGQEFGYFAFGGSTIILLFEKGSVEWDEYLLINGRVFLETLIVRPANVLSTPAVPERLLVSPSAPSSRMRSITPAISAAGTLKLMRFDTKSSCSGVSWLARAGSMEGISDRALETIDGDALGRDGDGTPAEWRPRGAAERTNCNLVIGRSQCQCGYARAQLAFLIVPPYELWISLIMSVV